MKKIALTLFVLCAAVSAEAQSFSEIELNQARALWLESGNAAGLSTAGLVSFLDFALNFEGQSGDFKHTYDASSLMDCSLQGNAVAELAGFIFTGKLLLDRSALKDVAFNTSLYQSSPLLKPYWFLDYDTVGYDWNRGNCAAEVNMATPLMADGRLALGFNFKADSKTARRDADISALYKATAMEFAPSAIFKLDGSNTIGATLRLANTPEKSDISSDAEEVSEVAFASGMGSYNMRHVNGVNPIGDVTYKNNFTGVSLQYERAPQSKYSDLLLNLGLTRGNTYMYAGESNMAAIDDISTDFSLTHIKGERRNRIFTLDASYHMMYGYDNTAYSSTHTLQSTIVNVLADYTAYPGASEESYSWFFGLRADASYLNQKRYLPSGSFKAPEVVASGLLGKNTAIGSDSELLCSIRGGYHFSFGAGYSYDSDETLISEEIYSAENDYLSIYYWFVSPQLRYTAKVSKKLAVYGLLRGNYVKPVDSESYRFSAGLGAGILF